MSVKCSFAFQLRLSGLAGLAPQARQAARKPSLRDTWPGNRLWDRHRARSCDRTRVQGDARAGAWFSREARPGSLTKPVDERRKFQRLRSRPGKQRAAVRRPTPVRTGQISRSTALLPCWKQNSTAVLIWQVPPSTWCHCSRGTAPSLSLHQPRRRNMESVNPDPVSDERMVPSPP